MVAKSGRRRERTRGHTRGRKGPADPAVRQRILAAAFAAFMEKGYAQASTLEIATRAQVSKATLYALVGNKRQMLAACIQERAGRLRAPAGLPQPVDRAHLARTLEGLGAHLLREVSEPTVLTVFRLAIAEAARAPEVARALDSIGVAAGRAAMTSLMSRARAAGVLEGRPERLAEQFSGLLWGSLMWGLLLGVVDRHSPQEIARRASDAAAAFLRIASTAGSASSSTDAS
jgi:AcrR family transcriptional regulator